MLVPATSLAVVPRDRRPIESYCWVILSLICPDHPLVEGTRRPAPPSHADRLLTPRALHSRLPETALMHPASPLTVDYARSSAYRRENYGDPSRSISRRTSPISTPRRQGAGAQDRARGPVKNLMGSGGVRTAVRNNAGAMASLPVLVSHLRQCGRSRARCEAIVDAFGDSPSSIEPFAAAARALGRVGWLLKDGGSSHHQHANRKPPHEASVPAIAPRSGCVGARVYLNYQTAAGLMRAWWNLSMGGGREALGNRLLMRMLIL